MTAIMETVSYTHRGSTTNGITAVTAVYVFVASLCSFKDNFGMSLQTGVSRRSTFLARLCTAGAMCAVMAAVSYTHLDVYKRQLIPCTFGKAVR